MNDLSNVKTMNTRFTSLAILLTLLCPFIIKAQCPNNNGFNSALAEPSEGNTNTACCVWGGEYITVPVTMGYNYTFQTCNTAVGDDSYLTLKRETDGADLDWDDNSCSPHATFDWTATFTGGVRVLVDISAACNSNASNHVVDVTNNGIMPVRWLDFISEANAESIELRWGTAFEQNASHFVIERSVDGINYQPIGEKAAQGDIQTESQYSYSDDSPWQGNNYYRLKEIDLNGAESFHPSILEVAFDGNAKDNFQVYPVPARDILHIVSSQTQAGKTQIRIIDPAGRTVYNNSFDSAGGRLDTGIDLSKFQAGTYFLEIRAGNMLRREQIVLLGK